MDEDKIEIDSIDEFDNDIELDDVSFFAPVDDEIEFSFEMADVMKQLDADCAALLA